MNVIVDQLFDDLDQLKSPEDDQKIEMRLKDTKQALDKVYAYPYQYYRKTRDAVRKRYGEGFVTVLATRTIRMTKEQMETARGQAALRVMQRNSKQTVLLFSFVEQRVAWLKSNDLLIDKIMLLMLASGSRRCEILGTGRSFFTYAPDFDKSHTHIRQIGLAKKTANTVVDEVVKPLIFLDYDEFLDILASVRDATADMPLDSNRLLSTFDNRLEALSRLCWPQFVSNGYPIGTHVCRSIYVSIAYQLHPSARASIAAFAARVLGHESFMQVPNYLHANVTMAKSGPIFDEAVTQYKDCVDKLVPAILVDDNGNEQELLPVPHRRLSKSEREQLKANRIYDLEQRNIAATRTHLRLLNID